MSDGPDRARPSRRTVLKGAGSALVSIGAGTAVQANVPDGADMVSIPKFKQGEKVLATNDVPADWWSHAQKVERELAGLLDQYDSVVFTDGKDEIAGRPALKYQVQHREDQAAPNNVPEEHRGVPVEVVEKGEPRALNCVNSDADPFYEGGQCVGYMGQNSGVTQNTIFGTAGVLCTLKSNRSVRHILTAFHVVNINNSTCSTPTGDRVHAGIDPNNNTQVLYTGEVTKYSSAKRDYTLVENLGPPNPIPMSSDGEIYQGGSGSINCRGRAVNLSQYLGTSETFYKYGITTEEETGTIHAIGSTVNLNDGCIDFRGSTGVEFDVDGGTGDSGGPIYLKEPVFGGPDEAFLASVSSYATEDYQNQTQPGCLWSNPNRLLGRRIAGPRADKIYDQIQTTWGETLFIGS